MSPKYALLRSREFEMKGLQIEITTYNEFMKQVESGIQI